MSLTQSQSETLAALWTRAQPLVGGYIASLIPDFGQVDDVLQQTAVAAVRKFNEYDPNRPFIAWAIGIARLEVRKHRHTRFVDRHVFDDQLIDMVTEQYQQMTPELEELRPVLNDCVSKVQGRARRVLEMRYDLGLQPTQIAQQIGMAATAVRVLLHRTRAAIRECILRRLNAAGGSQ